MGKRSAAVHDEPSRGLHGAAQSCLLARIAHLEAQLENAQMQARQVESLRKLGSWEVDLETNALTWSEGTYGIFGLSPEIPVTVEQALAFYPDEARDAIGEGLAAAVASGTPYDLTVPFTNAAGEHGWVRTLGQAQFGEGMRRVVGVIEDVTAEKLAQDGLRDLAYCDALTGLPNRRAFEARLSLLEAGRGTADGGGAALLLIDVDNFKAINDTHGHLAGDHLLRAVAARLQRCVRASDLVARLGGDEFGILLFDVEAPSLLERNALAVLEAVRMETSFEGSAIHSTASIGIAHTRFAAGKDSLFSHADMALYRAKAQGRDRAELYRSELRGTLDQKAEMLDAVRKAIDGNQFTVFFQPIVDLRTSLARGLEALVRWDHPVRGLLPPAEFEAAFDDPALSVAIDDFVLEHSLRQLRAWLDRGVPLAAVNVNASDAQLRRPDLAERVASLLAAHRLTPDRLKIEVVETAFLGRDTRQVAATIGRLADLGVVCALDDFGTGHASLTHLKQFRVERIKIDRSFVANMCADPFDRGLVKSLIELGRNLGIRVTAEGVETAEQLALLREYGCDCAQGYFIGRPVPASDVPEAVARWYSRQAIAPSPPLASPASLPRRMRISA